MARFVNNLEYGVTNILILRIPAKAPFSFCRAFQIILTGNEGNLLCDFSLQFMYIAMLFAMLFLLNGKVVHTLYIH